MAGRLQSISFSFPILCGLAAILMAGQAVQAPFCLVLGTRQYTFKRGSEVTLDVAVTNITDQKIYIAPRTGTSGWEIQDSDGRPVKKMEAVKSEKKPEPDGASSAVHSTAGSYSAFEIGPRQTLHFQEVVTNEFDLTRPGKYTIRAAHEFGNFLVKSNSITIVATP